MQPSYHLSEPQKGQPIKAEFGQGVVKSINALQPSVGYGMLISRTAKGTLYSLRKSAVGNRKTPTMPFDVAVNIGTTKAATTFTVATCGDLGNVNYIINGDALRITPMSGSREVVITDATWMPEDGERKFICVVFNYDRNEPAAYLGQYTFPTSYNFAIIDETTLADDAMASYGVKYYPIAVIQEATEEERENKGAYSKIFSFKLEGSDTRDFYMLSQLYHGEIFISLSTGGTKVAEVTNSHNAVYDCEVVGDDNPYTKYIQVNITDVALTSHIPVGTRLLVHGVSTQYLAGE